MAKLIVERPRHGGHGSFPRNSPREGKRVAVEDLSRREGIRRPWRRDRKYLNENLAPLRRFLQSCVGRPWDNVYSEVCERINRDSAVQLHVWQHLMMDVCTNPYEVLELVWKGFYGRRFFVDPKSGLLREKEHRRNRCPRPSDARPDRIKIDTAREYRNLDGLWYELQLAPLPEAASVYDLAMKRWTRDITLDEIHRFYGRAVYAAGKRQLNKREIRRLASGPI